MLNNSQGSKLDGFWQRSYRVFSPNFWTINDLKALSYPPWTVYWIYQWNHSLFRKNIRWFGTLINKEKYRAAWKNNVLNKHTIFCYYFHLIYFFFQKIFGPRYVASVIVSEQNDVDCMRREGVLIFNPSLKSVLF